MLPWPTHRRRAARVLPINERDEALLLHGFEPAHPSRRYWSAIGGAAGTRESAAAAAVRELREETRIHVDAAELGEPVAVDTVLFWLGPLRVEQEQVIHAIRLPATTTPDLTGLGWLESLTVDSCRWVSVTEIRGDEAAAVRLRYYIDACVRALREREGGRSTRAAPGSAR